MYLLVAREVLIVTVKQTYDFEADIPKVDSAPAINVWTVEDSLGKKIVVNGANLLVNPSLLAVEK